MQIPVALQLYSVRGECATDFLGVIREVAKMGYDGVEFAGFHGVDPAEIRAVLDEVGLRAEGTHTMLPALMADELAAAVQAHKTLGAKFAIIPWLPEEQRSTPEACAQTAAVLSQAAVDLAAYGLRTGFHAHEGDMKPLAGGISAWDLLAQHTPDSFIMQYDTANGISGGADPVAPILKWPGRSQSVHLKEYKAGVDAAVIGEGSVPWADVFAACQGAGQTEWYVVEYEGTEDSMEAVAKCLQNLRGMGV